MLEMWKAQVVVFTKASQVGKLPLPLGFRFVAFSRGTAPLACPIDDPGTYEVSLEMLRAAGGGLPICVATIKAEFVDAWEKLPIEAVDRMMDRVECGIASDGEVLQ